MGRLTPFLTLLRRCSGATMKSGMSLLDWSATRSPMRSSPEESDYRQKITEVRRQRAALPSPDDKMILFDRSRAAELRSFSEMVDAASGDKLQELVPWLIERVETADRRVIRIVPTEPARSFFAWAEQEQVDQECADVAPPDGFEPPTRTLGRCRSIH